MRRERAQSSSRARARRAAACALALWLLAPAAADARRPAIEGRLPASYTVVALAADGRTRTVEDVRGNFELVPPARTVTLHLLGSTGRYLGPVVVAGSGKRAVVRVRAGAKLGTLRVRDGWARAGQEGAGPPARPGPPGHSTWRRADRRGGVGTGAIARHGPGRSPDATVIGTESRAAMTWTTTGTWCPTCANGAQGGEAATSLARVDGLNACVDPVCSGTAAVEVAGLDDVDTALLIAIVAAVLALISLVWQIATALAHRRRHAIDVEARLGLPVYSQGAGRWAVFIEVFNRTDHPVRWVSAALETKDGRIFYLMEHPPGGELPAVIQPHDSHHTWVDCHELERQGLALEEPVIAAAKVATGEIYRSPAKRLASRRSRIFG